MTTAPTAPTLARCPGDCEHGMWPWHDQALGLEDDLAFVVELLEETAAMLDDFESDCERFLPPIDVLLFVGEHNWRDPALVHRLAVAVDQLARNAITAGR
jgi:hypothetical protein